MRKSKTSGHGVTLIELLIAALIVSIVAAGAVSSWSISSKIPATLRATELSAKIAVREIEILKAKRYSTLTVGTTTTYYDKSGIATTVTASRVYLATTTIAVPAGITATGTTKDLLEATVVVTKHNDTSKVYETQRTLMTFGGF